MTRRVDAARNRLRERLFCRCCGAQRVGYREAARETGVAVGTLHKFVHGDPVQRPILAKITTWLVSR